RVQKRGAARAWHYKAERVRRSGVRDLVERRRQGDAEGGEGKAGSGARGGAQEEAFAVLLDLGLGERVQVGHHGGPGGGGAGARRVEAVLQLLLQNEGEEAAGDVAADRFVQLVIDWPRLEQTFRRAKGSFHCPELFVDEHRLERRKLRIGPQHEHAVEILVLLDLGSVDGEAVALPILEKAAVSLVADEALVALLQLPLQGRDDGRAVGGVLFHLVEVAALDVAPPGERDRLRLVVDLAPRLHQDEGNERRGIVEDELAHELVGSLAHAQHIEEPARFELGDRLGADHAAVGLVVSMNTMSSVVRRSRRRANRSSSRTSFTQRGANGVAASCWSLGSSSPSHAIVR